ncbi:response regulator [Paenibacillus sp. J5C_2022]|uniref:helix-turn-helix domain-containing protein n=1 Tax=Paenibacillus sp. J5C2022 TaxID=2977129 RepID=UPI0021D048E1|nr:helix-turn-helix domain-containing protein [Paenibacillus sp. J5C2022]MCU6707788.1 response regulator [Paenibacillus sp. J5C2022]
MLVDDERHVLEGLNKMIDWKGLSISSLITAMSGEEAWRLFQEHRPDILLTDVSMAKGNGLELAAKIREVDPHIPILILSGYNDFEYARGAVHLNVARYILKPALFNEIQETIGEVIADLEEERKQRQYAEKFERYIGKSLPMLREQFIVDLLNGSYTGGELDEDHLRFYEIDNKLLSGGLVMNLILYRPEERARTEMHWQLLKFSVANVVQETAAAYDGHVQIYVLRFTDDKLPILLVNDDAEKIRHTAQQLAEAIVRNVGDHLDLDLNAAIGRWYGSARELSRSYSESIETLRVLEFEGYHKIMGADESDKALSASFRYPAMRIQQCIEAAHKMSMPEVFFHWEEIRKWLLMEGTPLATAQIASLSLLAGLLEEPEGEQTHGRKDTKLLPYIRRIQECRSKETISGLVEEQIESVLPHRESQVQSYIRNVITHIEQNYHETISFAELAQNMHLTRSYLSYLFKRETGTSFVYYLTQYRIEKAKELLRSGRHMIYEVSGLVGYSDPAYFSRAFKKVTGSAPNEYLNAFQGSAKTPRSNG